MPRLLHRTRVWPSFLLSFKGTKSDKHTQSNGHVCKWWWNIHHITQLSPTLNAATSDFSALSACHKQSTLQMTQCSYCSPLPLHFLIPQVTHRNVPGDFRSYPCDRGKAAACSAPLGSRSESPCPVFGLEPRFPSPPAAMGQAGQDRQMSLPCSTPGDCTNTETSPPDSHNSGFSPCICVMLLLWVSNWY